VSVRVGTAPPRRVASRLPQDATLCRAGFAGETQSRVGFL